MMGQLLRGVAIATLLGASACATNPKMQAQTSVSFEERLLATLPADWDSARGMDDVIVHFSPDGRYAAVLYLVTGEAHERPRCYVVVDGRKEPDVGRVGQTSPCFNEHDVHFSPDARHVAYVFRLGNIEVGREGLMVDGKPGPMFDEVEDPIFSADSRRFAYRAVENGKKFVVFDHVPQGREYDRADLPAFSSDGRKSAYRGTKHGPPDADGEPVIHQFIVLDGVKGDEFDEVGSPVFHPVSHELAYSAKRNGRYFMVGAARVSGDFTYLGDPVFSADGRRMACEAGRDGRFFILVDGRETTIKFESVANPFFSPDGRRVAYQGIRKATMSYAEYPSPTGQGLCMVVDGAPGEDCDFLWNPHFSENGHKLVYTMRQKDNWYVVFESEKLGGEYRDVEDPIVSLDGTRTAFVATQGDEAFVACGRQRSEPFDAVKSPVFSPNGRKIAFGARKGRELWWKVMEVK